MPDDCLICLRPLRLPDWTPALPCTCRPALHKTCWQAWVAHTGYETCVICRSPAPPPVRVGFVFFGPPHPQPIPWWRDMERMTTLLGAFFLLWIILLLSFPQQTVIYVPPPHLQGPAWLHDEL